MECADDALTGIFKVVGEKYGFDDVEARYTAFRDMKVKWTRSYRWIRFDVSDYLADAPQKVLESIAETIYGKIRGEHDVNYSDEVCKWVTSHEFLVSKQPVYVQRCRGLSLSPTGKCRDLEESYDRLALMSLVTKDPDVYLGWCPSGASRRCGFSSVLMKTVNMSSTLDREEVPEDVLDFCLYSQLAHISLGFDPFAKTSRTEEYDKLLDLFPGRRDVEKTMESLCIKP